MFVAMIVAIISDATISATFLFFPKLNTIAVL